MKASSPNSASFEKNERDAFVKPKEFFPGAVAIGIAAFLGYAAWAPTRAPGAPEDSQSSRTALQGPSRPVDPPYAPRKPGTLTFNKDIAPIIFGRCASCHHSGEVSHISLLSYQDVKKLVQLISVVTQSRSMPPWKPEPGYGEFLGERRLSREEIGTIKQWVEEGAPEGKIEDPPRPPDFSESWALGAPDLVVKMPEAFTVPAEGADVYHCFVLPMNLSEDRPMVAFEFQPGNRKVVHHAILVQDAKGAARRLEASPGAGYSCFGGFGFLPSQHGYVGGWVAGTAAWREPEGVAQVLKKGADLLIQIHFHPNGRIEKEQSAVGFYFAKKPPAKIPTDLAVGSYDIDIPPGAKAFKVRGTAYVTSDVEALAVFPHAHYLAREIKASAVLPDESVKPLIWIKDWDFNWQERYRFTSPVKLPQGTRLEMEVTYDNSADNPHNPNHPPQRVTWGEGTTDEMAEVHLEVISQEAAHPAQGRNQPQ